MPAARRMNSWQNLWQSEESSRLSETEQYDSACLKVPRKERLQAGCADRGLRLALKASMSSLSRIVI